MFKFSLLKPEPLHMEWSATPRWAFKILWQLFSIQR